MSRIAAKVRAFMGSKLAPDTQPVSAELGAEALAMGGGGTAAKGEVDLTVKDAGAVTWVKGTATASSAAAGEGAFADAGTFGQVEGADLVFTWTRKTSGETEGAAQSDSSTRVFAIDLPFDLAGGPKVMDFYSERQISTSRPTGPEPQGSTAVADADVEASGDGATHTEAFTDALALVGYSDISAYGSAIVG
jgi:hypothetical protein